MTNYRLPLKIKKTWIFDDFLNLNSGHGPNKSIFDMSKFRVKVKCLMRHGESFLTLLVGILKVCHKITQKYRQSILYNHLLRKWTLSLGTRVEYFSKETKSNIWSIENYIMRNYGQVIHKIIQRGNSNMAAVSKDVTLYGFWASSGWFYSLAPF